MLRYALREPRRSCTALTAGVKAISLDGVLVVMAAVLVDCKVPADAVRASRGLSGGRCVTSRLSRGHSITQRCRRRLSRCRNGACWPRYGPDNLQPRNDLNPS